MGCDIHAYIDFDDFVMQDGKFFVSCFASLHLRRDYNLFGLMAGVRDEKVKLFDPRGLPENLSCTTKHNNQLYVSDKNSDEERSCSREDAERWVAGGSSAKWVDDGHNFVTDPDWHTHSWLNCKEMERVLKVMRWEDYKDQVRAIVAMMDALNGNNPERSRIVFWFDN